MLAVCEAVPNVLRYVLFGTLCCANVLVDNILCKCMVPNVPRYVLFGTLCCANVVVDNILC